MKVHFVFVNFCLAPSAAPTSTSVSEVTFSSITVQWGAVDCIHRNGNITGYSVRYGVVGSGSAQTMSVSGEDARQTTISNLIPSTTYSIQVAAENSAGIGVYSDPREATTNGMILCYSRTVKLSIDCFMSPKCILFLCTTA